MQRIFYRYGNFYFKFFRLVWKQSEDIRLFCLGKFINIEFFSYLFILCREEYIFWEREFFKEVRGDYMLLIGDNMQCLFFLFLFVIVTVIKFFKNNNDF